MKALTRSIITCSTCGTRAEADMPTDACLVHFECQSCHTVLRPNPGDCCVFCSYGTIKCPPVQLQC